MLSSGVLLSGAWHSVSEFVGTLCCPLRIRGSTNHLVFLGQMLPCLLIVRHDLSCTLERTHRFPVTTLFDISDPEMFPGRCIVRIKLCRGPQVIDGGVGLPDGFKTESELRVNQEIAWREMGSALQWRHRFGDPIQVNVTVAHGGEHV